MSDPPSWTPKPKCDFTDWCKDESVVAIIDYRLPASSPESVRHLCRVHLRLYAANLLAAHHMTVGYEGAPWTQEGE